MNGALLGEFECAELNEIANLDEIINEYFATIGPYSVRWPAAGRFGYRQGIGDGFSMVSGQLGWVEAFENEGNRGSHEDEFDRRFFTRYFVPLFQEDDTLIDEAWTVEVDSTYEDEFGEDLLDPFVGIDGVLADITFPVLHELRHQFP